MHGRNPDHLEESAERPGQRPGANDGTAIVKIHYVRADHRPCMDL